MTSLTTQRLIAAVFLVLGGWSLLAPSSVIELAIRPEYRSDDFLTTFAMACFGAQACIFGIVAMTARFTKMTFLSYGIVLLPFFLFNYYYYFEVPVLTEIGLIDFVGNTIMLALCWHGYRAAPE